MIKIKKYTMLVVIVAVILTIAYSAFEVKQARIAPLSANSVASKITEVLEADPNYIIVDSFIVHADEPNRFVPTAFVDYLDLRLQVIVRGASSIVLTSPRWHIRLGRLLRRLPSLLMLKGKRQLPFGFKRLQRIDIYVLEPTDEEMQRLKRPVRSLDGTHDIPIEFTVYFPDR